MASSLIMLSMEPSSGMLCPLFHLIIGLPYSINGRFTFNLELQIESGVVNDLILHLSFISTTEMLELHGVWG